MKALFGIGLVVLILGVASLLVPVPNRERNDVRVGDLSVGITTHHDEKIPPVASAAMILGGVGMLLTARSRMT